MTEPAVLSLVWDLMRGGTEGQCARVAMELAGNGHTHRVAVFRRNGFFLPDVEAACGQVEHLDVRRRRSPMTWMRIRRLAGWCRQQEIGVLHAWDADAAIFGQRVAACAGIPLMTSRRDLGEIYPDWKLASMARADRSAALVVANAQAIADKVVPPEVARARVRVIPNILDVEEFDLLRRDRSPWTRPDDGRAVVVNVNRLDPEKDVGTLLHAHAKLRAEDRPWLVIAGDGAERKALEALGNEQVVFLGEVHDIPALLGQADIGVLCPNRNEGLSNSVLEMMAAGLPCVVTDCGGNAELIRDAKTGFVVPPRDSDALSRAMENLLAREDRGRAMGRNARAQVEENHLPSAVAQRFAACYRDACEIS